MKRRLLETERHGIHYAGEGKTVCENRIAGWMFIRRERPMELTSMGS